MYGFDFDLVLLVFFVFKSFLYLFFVGRLSLLFVLRDGFFNGVLNNFWFLFFRYFI